MQFIQEESTLIKFRITLDKLKQDVYIDELLPKILDLSNVKQPHLITHEVSKKGVQHYHGLVYSQNIIAIKQLLRENVTSRGFSCNSYDTENNRTPEYYFGYILKENPPNIIIQHDIQVDNYRSLYLRSNQKTSDDCLTFVKENYPPIPYNSETLMNLILDYYKTTKKVFDKYIILRRSFHMCRLQLFENIERTDIIKSLPKIMEVSDE